MREMILHSKQSINEKLSYYAFRMNQSSINRPTVFEIEFFIKMLYKYCFYIKKTKFVMSYFK
ncbi:hypothetical protein [Enterococcus cecorum]|uniref:hypothetical protein n=1 Tax=Enterococcus cecorum TaxID=44008 RepID=UPI00342A980D